MRNLEVAIKATKRVGAHAQGTLVYTISPVHTIDHYIRVAKELVELGVDSICIKDMSGILSPYVAYELVKRLKETVNVPIQLHSHYTSGMASMTYLKAIEAGVDAIDTAISPLALGTSQPATETMVAALKGTQYDTGLDLELLSEIASYFKEVKRNHYKETEFSMVMGVDTDVLVYQVPGGMLSNLIAQLREQKALDKYEEVLKEIPKVREDLGYPPLVTPMSQMVGTQAVLNVITGERYKMVPKEVKDYVKGLYGRPPAPISEEVKRKIMGDEETIQVRPADLLKPQFEEAKEEIKEYYEQEEDVLTYVLFPQIAKKFFEYRRARKYYIDSTLINSEYMTYPV
ncbi:oxaloacetate decarboxylase [Caldanaerobacter subterraneus subsp. pacificus DSM 12653]|uniref:Oxaloacetate decarboxylase n=1 Tax=Caldanaerobacter subterraneus subsp. pacificus DSM 12653 TaxID=391606 RepID=B7R7L9_9THEO|nr:oxaloacetate decarboxylase [Caldanaerobacter subterraneus subsp. pacificus DSM 12653]